MKSIQNVIREACREKIERDKKRGILNRPVRAMVAGIPNVGKSSLINRMAKGSRADVEDRPGVTRDNRWFSISKGFEMLDTPGVLWPKFEDKLVGEHLAFTGAVRDQVVDLEWLACRLIEELKTAYPKAIQERYKMQDIDLGPLQSYEILEQIGKNRGMLMSGGQINTERAAIAVLDECRAAKLGRITLEQVRG